MYLADFNINQNELTILKNSKELSELKFVQCLVHPKFAPNKILKFHFGLLTT